jgi:hypothetical protein
MKNTKALLFLICVAILASFAIDMANAAIVPFDGIEYSWFHDGNDKGAEGGWITEINDTVEVRPGDTMQFQNRWYNGYAGTVDTRISYGGRFRYTCIGADEYVLYGLNYGSYYPSGTESVPFYSAVTNCSEEIYDILVNHQYVCNGVMFGAGYTLTMSFQRRTVENGTQDYGTDTDLHENEYATPIPSATAQPSATVLPAVTEEPVPTPGFSFDTIILTSGAFAIAYICERCLHK